MAGALDTIRVIDFGQYIAGPLASMFLADQGADVIRVDPPGGPRYASPANATWNRGKRSIVLDLKRPEDRRVAERLIASADVVVENFRPGVMDRLGLGAIEMTSAHPRLIYCSLPGFASDDPRAGLPAWEGIVAAATDTYRAAGGVDGATPTFTAIPIASTFAALLAGIAISSALFSRERDARGQRIEVPLFDATFAAIGAVGLSVQGKAGGGRPDDFAGGNFQCADGRWVMVSLAKPVFQERFVRTARLADRFDPDRIGMDKSIRDALRAGYPALFKTRTADEWEGLGRQADVPLLKIRSAGEWMESEHARQSASVIELDDARLGPVAQPNSPLRLSLTGAKPSRPAPALDAHRDAILAELDGRHVVAADVDVPPARHAALEGVKVVDLSQVLAGPTGGRTLAEFGAEVVKINPPDEDGAGIRLSVHRYHTDVNRGKRTMLLDLKQPGALDVVWRLLDDADVVLHNFRPGVMERLGIGYDEVSRRRPDIIYVSITAYGDGPWGARPGYEGFGQASTGIAARQGGDGRPSLQPFPVNDYGTGLSAAFAATLALYHRERTGQGQQGAAALAYTGTILQSPYLQLYEGKQWDEPAGPRARGFAPLQALYRAADGWFYLGASESQLAMLASIDGLAGIEGLAGDTLMAALDARFATANVATWCERIAARGLGAHRLVGMRELMSDPWVIARGLSVTREHDTGEVITTVGPPARLSRTPVNVGRAAASPGADGIDVLASIGMAHEAERLSGAGAFWREPLPVA